MNREEITFGRKIQNNSKSQKGQVLNRILLNVMVTTQSGLHRHMESYDGQFKHTSYRPYYKNVFGLETIKCKLTL